MLLKFYFFISLFFFYSVNIQSEENCNFNTKDFVIDMMNFKNIISIEVEANQQKKWVMNAIRALHEQDNIKRERKKKFKSKLIVKYPYGKCFLDAEIRLHGDWKFDHITWKNNFLRTSLDVEILNSNVAGITQFKLFLPESRNSYNEVISSEILRKLGYLSPRTKIIKSKINGSKYNVIFQEKIVKEFLENNNLREGVILEGDESLMFLGLNGQTDLNTISLSRVININWAKRSKSNMISALKALEVLQKAYISKSRANLNEYIDWTEIINHLPKNKDYEEYIQKNEIFLIALGNTHAMYANNRKFYFDHLSEKLYPIYYDGQADINEPCFFLNCSKVFEEFYKEYLDKSVIIDARKEFLELINDKTFVDKTITEFQIPKDKFFEYINYVKNNFEKFSKIDTSFKTTENINFDFNSYKNKAFKMQSDLVFLYLNEIDWIEQTVTVDLCEVNECKYNNEISFEIFFDILRRDINLQKNIFFISTKFNELFALEELKFDNDNLKVYFTKGSEEPKYDKIKRELFINQNNAKDQYVIKNSKLKNIKIFFNGNDTLNQLDQFNGLNHTGCLNIIDSTIENINIIALNGMCEDSINIIRSSGKIDLISVENAFSDAVDFDFSKIKLKSLNVKNAINDCSDFSGGIYEIVSLNLVNCGDKALSVGEFSQINIEKLVTMNSNYGLAVKDSSVLKIKDAELNTMKFCLAAYNKKNEFNGGLINIESINCKNFFKFQDMDNSSNIIIEKLTKENEFDTDLKITSNLNYISDYKTYASKDLINVVVEIPKTSNEKWEVSKITGNLERDFNMGKPRYTLLNYPFNYGMIPRTSLPIKLGGDGDPLDVILIADQFVSGEVIESKVIGAIQMLDGLERDDKIITISKYQNLPTEEELKKMFNEVKLFFENYKGKNQVKFLKYLNNNEAIELINISKNYYNKFGIRKR